MKRGKPTAAAAPQEPSGRLVPEVTGMQTPVRFAVAGESGMSRTADDEQTPACATGRMPGASPAPATAPGVSSSNTPPPTSNVGQFTGGEDWFEWCAYVEWGKAWPTLQQSLELAKTVAGDAQLRKETGGDSFMIGNEIVFLEPSGASLGKKGKGQYMAYRLKCNGLGLQIANRESPGRTAPNVIIRADGTQCLNRGVVGCLDLGRKLICDAGGTILKEKLSRVDMCLDLPGVSIAPFAKAYDERRYICRATKRTKVESTGITLYLGKSPLMLRIYDKAVQLKEQPDIIKQFLMIERRWHGEAPESATRVEFQLNRGALKQRGIDSPADYLLKRGDLIHYLCQDWIRFTARAVDKTNTTRARVLPLWKKVATGFANWAGSSTGQDLSPLPTDTMDVRQLLKQAIGAVLTAAVLQGLSPQTPIHVISYVTAAFTPLLGKMRLADEVARRKA